jgi:hypothetical protein
MPLRCPTVGDRRRSLTSASKNALLRFLLVEAAVAGQRSLFHFRDDPAFPFVYRDSAAFRDQGVPAANLQGIHSAVRRNRSQQHDRALQAHLACHARADGRLRMLISLEIAPSWDLRHGQIIIVSSDRPLLIIAVIVVLASAHQLVKGRFERPSSVRPERYCEVTRNPEVMRRLEYGVPPVCQIC